MVGLAMECHGDGKEADEMKIRFPVLIGVGAAALLAQCLALHALAEEDIATLDAAFEATFREGPTGGFGV